MIPPLAFIGAGIALLALFLGRKKATDYPPPGDLTGPNVGEVVQDENNAPPEVTSDPQSVENQSVVSDVADAISAAVETPIAVVAGAKYAGLIEDAARQYDVPVLTLYRLLYQESRFRDDIITGKVRSRTGALGIAQFMPATALQELGSVEAALDPKLAIPGAARYLAKLIRATGSEKAGVAAYNWGIGNVQKKGLARAPQETVTYVKDVTGESLT